MSLIDEATTEIINEFGEPVEILPKEEVSSEDSGVWRGNEGWDEFQTTEVQARVLRTPVDSELLAQGISDDAKAVIYFDDPETVEKGDKIRYNGHDWVVAKHWTKQLGNGPYRQVCEAKAAER